MSAYLIAAVNRRDLELYKQYEEAGIASIEGFSIEHLALDDNPDVLEGELPGQRIVLMKFSDKAELQRWYDSEIYRKCRPIRHQSADTPFVIAIDGSD